MYLVTMLKQSSIAMLMLSGVMLSSPGWALEESRLGGLKDVGMKIHADTSINIDVEQIIREEVQKLIREALDDRPKPKSQPLISHTNKPPNYTNKKSPKTDVFGFDTFGFNERESEGMGPHRE